LLGRTLKRARRATRTSIGSVSAQGSYLPRGLRAESLARCALKGFRPKLGLGCEASKPASRFATERVWIVDRLIPPQRPRDPRRPPRERDHLDALTAARSDGLRPALQRILSICAEQQGPALSDQNARKYGFPFFDRADAALTAGSCARPRPSRNGIRVGARAESVLHRRPRSRRPRRPPVQHRGPCTDAE
jgi:hypothetical protein